MEQGNYENANKMYEALIENLHSTFVSNTNKLTRIDQNDNP